MFLSTSLKCFRGVSFRTRPSTFLSFIFNYRLLTAIPTLPLLTFKPPTKINCHVMPAKKLELPPLPKQNPVLFTFKCTFRFFFITFLSLPLLLLLPVYLFIPSFSHIYHTFLINTLELLGPTFIKLGQWGSTRGDLLPEGLVEGLKRMHDRVRGHSIQKSKEIFKKTFGKSMEEVFEFVEAEPIGSGCIAQVHECKLKGSNKKVAVKIKHPNIDSLIETDLQILKIMAQLINLIPTMQWLSLDEEVDVFKDMMMCQLDLRLEADNLSRFRTNFQLKEENDKGNVWFPVPFLEWTGREVLTEELIEGLPIRYFIEEKTKFNPEIAGIGLNSFLKMLINDNFIHADLHPGNILIQFHHHNQLIPKDELLVSKSDSSNHGDLKLNTKKLNQMYDQHVKVRMVFLDTGLVTELSELNLKNFLDLFTAIADGDGKRVARLMVERSRMPGDKLEKKCLDYFGFESKMSVIIQQVQKQTFRLANIKIGDLLKQVFQMVRQHHVKIESDFTNLVMSIMVLEGLGRQLDSEVDLLDAARPLLRFRESGFYMYGGGVFFKLSAFLEARYLIRSLRESIFEKLMQQNDPFVSF